MSIILYFLSSSFEYVYHCQYCDKPFPYYPEGPSKASSSIRPISSKIINNNEARYKSILN